MFVVICKIAKDGLVAGQSYTVFYVHVDIATNSIRLVISVNGELKLYNSNLFTVHAFEKR